MELISQLNPFASRRPPPFRSSDPQLLLCSESDSAKTRTAPPPAGRC